jgi:hypothetical protein
MERRLNCYNYIFSSCLQGGRCPYGHVIVDNKDEYLRKYEMNEQGTRDNTSPKGNFQISLWNNKDLGGPEFFNDKGGKKKKFRAADDNQVGFLNCVNCNTLKCESKNVAQYLRNKNEPFVCRECFQKNIKIKHDGGVNENSSGGFFDRLGVYNM